VRALIGKLIIAAAKNGERDPIRIQSQALMEFSIDDVSVPVVSIARDIPVPNRVPVYALIACTA
jgi:LEA14-like dessication related protein